MGEKAEYKSAIRSRRLIRQAFIELIQEKDLEKITVTDVIIRADINRGTFYAHYQDIRAVIEQIENEVIEKMLDILREFHYDNFFENPMHLLLKISSWLEEDLEFYKVLINSRGSEQFLIKLKNIFVSHMETDSDIPAHLKMKPEFFIHANFFAGGIVNLYQVWLRGELTASLNEISQQICKIVAIYSPLFCEEKNKHLK
jgi:AcrR family transcriptional regulator